MDAVAAVDPKVAGLLLATAARDEALNDDFYATTLSFTLLSGTRTCLRSATLWAT